MTFFLNNCIGLHTYPLNKSKSKTISVELIKSNEDTWQPCIILGNNYWSGVKFTLGEWSALVDNIWRIQKHFDGQDSCEAISLLPAAKTESC